MLSSYPESARYLLNLPKPGEHGVGKKHCMHASPTYRLMATIKRAVDPDNIMNLRKAISLN